MDVKMQAAEGSELTNSGPSLLYPFSLQPDVFRLMRFVDPASADTTSNRRELHFELIETTFDRVPPYDALSYRWQDYDPAKLDIHIICNNVKIPVGENLYAALQQLSITTGRSEYIWVDFVCINQSDSLEKQLQMLKMPQLYSNAHFVIAWLGIEDDVQQSDQAIDSITQIVTSLDAIDHPYYTGTEKPLTADDVKVFDYIVKRWNTDRDPRSVFVWHLLSRAWFGRAWTLQEAALASKNCVMMCGTKIIRYSVFQHFAERVANDQVGHWALASSAIRSREYGTDPDNPPRPPLAHFMITSRMRKALSGKAISDVSYDPSIRIINSLRTMECMDPRDRIFAASAFLPEQFVHELRAHAPLSTEELYINLAEVEIGQNRNLHCLAAAGLCQQQGSYPNKYMTEITSKVLYLPSWVPDWTYRKINDPLWVLDADLIDHCGRHLYQTAIHLDTRINIVNDSANPNTISVYGIVVHEISACAEPYSVFRLQKNLDPDKQPNYILEMFYYYMNHFDSMIALAQQHYHPTKEISASERLTDIRQTIIGSMMPAVSGATSNNSLLIRSQRDQIDPIFDDFHNDVQRLEGICSGIVSNEAAVPRKRPQLITVASGMCKGRRFFVTSDGGMGMGPDITQVGDKICVLYGACTPFVIRPVADSGVPRGRTCYNLVGECYMHGLMDGEISSAKGVVPDYIHLV